MIIQLTACIAIIRVPEISVVFSRDVMDLALSGYGQQVMEEEMMTLVQQMAMLLAYTPLPWAQLIL